MSSRPAAIPCLAVAIGYVSNPMGRCVIWPWQTVSDPAVTSALTTIAAQLADLAAKVGALSMTLDELKAKLQADNDALVAAVSRATTIEQSVETLLNGQAAQIAGLRQQVKDLQAQVAAGATVDATAFQPLLDSIDAQLAAGSAVSDKLAAAVTANTPAQ